MESYPKYPFSALIEPGQSSGVQLLKLSGPFTIQSVQEFQAAARNSDASILIVDLTEVPYLDSAAVGSLVGIHVSRENHNRRYALVGVNERILTVFEVSKVGQFLVMYPTALAAEAALT